MSTRSQLIRSILMEIISDGGMSTWSVTGVNLLSMGGFFDPVDACNRSRHEGQLHPPTSLIAYRNDNNESSMDRHVPWKYLAQMQHCKAVVSNPVEMFPFCFHIEQYVSP